MTNSLLPSKKIALVYDWAIAPHGGAEDVLQALHAIFPKAPLFTSVWNKAKTPWTTGWDVRTSFLQDWSFFQNNHRLAAPLLPLAFESLDLSEYDIIISISTFAAKGILTLPHQLHFAYVLSPPRFLHTHADQYWQEYQPNQLLSWLVKPLKNYLHRWDKVAAIRPDKVFTISNLVAERVEQSYGTTIDGVIYPPVPTFKIDTVQHSKPLSSKSLISGGRLVAYKRFDLVIRLAQELGRPVIIFGDGPEKDKLRKVAEKCSIPVTFTGAVSQDELELLANQACLAVYPAEEDFGITQVQFAQAGIPLIVHEKTGATELIKTLPNVHTVTHSTLENLVALAKRVNQSTLQHQQQKRKIYDTTTFGSAFLEAVETSWKGMSL